MDVSDVSWVVHHSAHSVFCPVHKSPYGMGIAAVTSGNTVPYLHFLSLNSGYTAIKDRRPVQGPKDRTDGASFCVSYLEPLELKPFRFAIFFLSNTWKKAPKISTLITHSCVHLFSAWIEDPEVLHGMNYYT